MAMPDPGLPIFREPQCIVETDADGKLWCVDNVVRQVAALERPLVVVTIAGLYRTGKSYLMNRLARRRTGFALGSTIQPKTKGMWAWAFEHPNKPDYYLLLLDTEGLGDAFKGDAHHDTQIYCLATLLSSLLVYNALRVIDDGIIQQLQFIAEMSKNIRSKNKSPDGSDDDFDWHFPDFILVLRDFDLDLVQDGNEISSDDYFESCIQLKEGSGRQIEKYNLPRKCIRNYFKSRRCFTFDRPASKAGLKELEKLKDEDLSRDFVRETQEFCDHVHNNARVKELENGRQIVGSMWATLLECYVEHIRQGAIPCIEGAVEQMSRIQNFRAVEESLNLYRDLMLSSFQESVTQVGIPEWEGLDILHGQCIARAVDKFTAMAIFDEKEDYFNELLSQLNNAYEDFRQQNYMRSTDECNHELEILKVDLDNKVDTGYYRRAGGYSDYVDDLENICELFLVITEGKMAQSRALAIFKMNQRDTQDRLFAEDMAIGGIERDTAESQRRAERAERQREHEETQRRLAEERSRQVEQEMIRRRGEMERRGAEDRRRAERRFAELVAARQREQEQALKTGHDREMARLRSELNKLR